MKRILAVGGGSGGVDDAADVSVGRVSAGLCNRRHGAKCDDGARKAQGGFLVVFGGGVGAGGGEGDKA